MGAIGHDPLKYIEGGGLIPIGHVLITCPPSLQHRDLFPNRFGIGCIRELGVLAVHAPTRMTFYIELAQAARTFLRVRQPSFRFARLPCEPRGRGRASFSTSHDLCANSEVGRHFPPCTTSVRTRRSGVIFRPARPLCELGGRASFSASHDLCAHSEVGRHFPSRTTSMRTRRSGVIFRLARPLCAVCSTSVHHLRFARPRSIIRSTSVHRSLDLGSPFPIRTTSVRRSLDLSSPSPIRTTSVCRSLDLSSPSPIRSTSVRFARPRFAAPIRMT